jgi:hypothetical protein
LGSSKPDAPSITPSGDEGVALGQGVVPGAETFFGRGTSAVMANQQSRDKVLLGVASVAVAAALGVACQKRFAEADSALQRGRRRL